MLRHRFVVLGLLTTVFTVATCARAAPTTVLLSATTAGAEGSNNSSLPCINADGRYVAFVSTATNLVSLDTNGVDDVFFRDLQTSATTRVSISTAGAQANGASTHPSMSADGRYIAFQSAATNLVAGKGQGIYLRDRQASTTTFIATGTAPVVSADGAFIAFVSTAALVPADTNGLSDVYVAERATGTLSLASVATDGTLGTGDSGVGGVALNADGSVVAFQSVALNLVAGDTQTGGDIFVRDRTANTTERVSIGNDGSQGNQASSVPAISADGHLVAFESGSDNLIAVDNNTSVDVFMRDRTALTTTRVSVDPTGTELPNDSRHAVFSADGRYIAFETDSPNAVPGKTNGFLDVLIRDTVGSTTIRASMASTGVQMNGNNYHTALSQDGRYVAYTSEASNAVPGLSGGVNNVVASGPLFDTPGQVAFTTQPASGNAGVAFTTQPVVEIRNLDGTRKWDYGGAVTLTIKAGTGRPGAVLSGTATVNAVHGTATFTGLSIDKSNTGYVLTATSGALTSADSAAFDILQTPTKVVYVAQPGGASAGAPFTTQPQIAIQDAESNIVASYAGNVTIALKPGTGRTGAALGGTLSVPVVGGTASFTNLSLNLAGSGYVLTATSGTLTSADSAAFTVAQTPTKVSYSVQPGGASAGLAFTTQPVMQVLDGENNVVVAYTGPVTVAIKAGTGRAGAVLSGTTTVNAIAGVATFTGLSIDKANSGYVLTATSGTLTSADSAAFTVAQTPTKVSYSVQPGGASAGLAFTTQPVVQVLDGENNVVLAYTGPVTVAIKAGTGRAGAVLSGTTTVNAIAGVATFTGLSIDKANSGYVLTATSGTLTSADSAAFTVAQTPTKVSYSVQPGGASAGLAFTTQPVVQVLDGENNVVLAYTGPVTVAIKAGTGRAGAVLSGTTTVNAIAGVATFTGLSIDKANSGYVLTATSGTLTSADSAAFTVAQTPTKVSYSVQPGGASAGIAFTTQPVVQVLDGENNVVLAYTGPVTVAIKAGTGRAGAVLSGTTTVNAVAGVATFTGLTIDKANVGYVLTATSGTLTSADSASFTVAQTPTKVSYSVQPGGASAGLAFTTQPVVQVLDGENNVVLAYTGPVTVAIKAGTGRAGAVLSGTTTVNAIAGVATFTGLSIDLPGPGYILHATSGSLTSADSAAFTVAQLPFVLADVMKALRIAGGLTKATSTEMIFYNVVQTGASASAIDILDADRIARKVSGLEVNP